jgi:hypothetical protein
VENSTYNLNVRSKNTLIERNNQINYKLSSSSNIGTKPVGKTVFLTCRNLSKISYQIIFPAEIEVCFVITLLLRDRQVVQVGIRESQ